MKKIALVLWMLGWPVLCKLILYVQHSDSWLFLSIVAWVLGVYVIHDTD